MFFLTLGIAANAAESGFYRSKVIDFSVAEFFETY
jgi:hypothetical protein